MNRDKLIEFELRLYKVRNKEQARELAIDWQVWAGEQNQIGDEPTLYTSDLVEWHGYFQGLAKRYGLIREFRENGII